MGFPISTCSKGTRRQAILHLEYRLLEKAAWNAGVVNLKMFEWDSPSGNSLIEYKNPQKL